MKQFLALYTSPKMLGILVLGMVAGIPLSMVGSTLSWWLGTEGVALSSISLFIAARNPYSLKYLWSPIVDRANLPLFVKRFGRRRGWAIPVQLCLMGALVALGFSNPAEHLGLTFACAAAVAFFSATQDILIDTFRIESLSEDEQGAGAAAYIFGYRVSVLLAGAGALALSTWLSWEVVYSLMALTILPGMIVFLLMKEPSSHTALAELNKQEARLKTRWSPQVGARLAACGAWLTTAVVYPFKEFFTRKGAWLILGAVILYKLPDAYIGAMSYLLYQDLGFTALEVAAIIKVVGLVATLAGVILGGFLIKRYHLFSILMIAGGLQIASNGMFSILSVVGHNEAMLTATIIVENLTGGIGTSAFVALLSVLANRAFTATQYALLSSVMILPRDWFAATSGSLVEAVDWVWFFIISGSFGIPALVLLFFMKKRGILLEPPQK